MPCDCLLQWPRLLPALSLYSKARFLNYLTFLSSSPYLLSSLLLFFSPFFDLLLYQSSTNNIAQHSVITGGNYQNLQIYRFTAQDRARLNLLPLFMRELTGEDEEVEWGCLSPFTRKGKFGFGVVAFAMLVVASTLAIIPLLWATIILLRWTNGARRSWKKENLRNYYYYHCQQQ